MISRALVLAAVLVTAACSASTSAAPAGAPAGLANTFASPELLAQHLLDALARRDLDALRALPLSEAEFREQVWPELPASRPERNMPFEYAWEQMHQRSGGSLSETVSRYGGRPLRFVRTRFTGETTRYSTFSVMRDSEIVAADDTGRELILKLYGSAMVRDGRYKVFSYVVD